MIDKPMLACDANPKKIQFPVLASIKHDGVRGLKVNQKALARSFKPIPNDYVREWIEANIPNGMDGEIGLRDPLAEFNDVTSAIMSKGGQPDFVFRVFDYVKGSPALAFEHRFDHLAVWWIEHINKPQLQHADIVEQHLMETQEELDALHEKHLRDGHEGTMLRDPKAPYKFGRSTVREGYNLRLKPFMDEEAEVIELVELMVNNNEQTRDELGRAKRSSAKAGKVPGDTLGGFKLRFKDGTEFGCGTGTLTHEQKQRVWDMRAQYVGALAKIKHQANPYVGRKPGSKPRIPVFLGFRDKADT